MTRHLYRALVLALVLLSSTACLAACSGAPERVSMPALSAGPDVVLATYLKALKAGDCETAAALGVPPFEFGNGELCGHLTVEAYELTPGLAEPNPDERIYSTQLTTEGGDDSLPDGQHTWFYSLKKQANGSWRLIGGGGAP
jgi:hypothetical protein